MRNKQHVILGPQDGEFLQSEVNPSMCREEVTLRNPEPQAITVYPGHVLTEVEPGVFEPLKLDPDNGSSRADAINFYHIDLGVGEAQPVVVVKRLAEVTRQRLVWPRDITDAQIADALNQLEAQFIIAREELQ